MPKSVMEPINRSKNKFNNKIILIFHSHPNARIHILCNSFNPSRLFNPMQRKLTPNKDRSAICMTPLSLLFSLCLSATQKNKKLSLSSDLSLPKIQKLSHTIAQSPRLQLAATTSHTSTISGVPVRSCLSPSVLSSVPPPLVAAGSSSLSLYCLFSFIFLFLFFSFYLPFRSD